MSQIEEMREQAVEGGEVNAMPLSLTPSFSFGSHSELKFKAPQHPKQSHLLK